jgi:steroid 5-alpha reductase family enzyme
MDLLTLSYVVLAVAIAIHLYASLWFVVSLITSRNDVADIAWGFGISLVGMTALIAADEPSMRLNLMAALVFFWGSRLSMHIHKRVLSHNTEDYRYAQWRTTWKYFMVRSYLQVYLLQGLLMIVVGYAVIHVAAAPVSALGIVDIVALLVWIAGFTFEVIADKQLKAFVAKPHKPGSVLDTGLWRYSRHPNYFGEVLQWWGIWLFALSVPLGWIAIISPLAITFLILRVSGVPMLEKALEKDEAYRAYQKRTSVLIPLPPKKS